ncbi:unnamed protein product [Caenorhabditis brenneri]
MAPPEFFASSPNRSQFMPTPPQFNMPAGGDFWNLGMHPFDVSSNQEACSENRNLRRQLEAEVVPYKNPGLPNTQQQQSTSGCTRANVEPVADISTHSVDNRELLMSVYGGQPTTSYRITSYLMHFVTSTVSQLLVLLHKLLQTKQRQRLLPAAIVNRDKVIGRAQRPSADRSHAYQNLDSKLKDTEIFIKKQIRMDLFPGSPESDLKM